MNSAPFSVPSINDATQHPPQAINPDGARSWITRATNFVVAVTLCKPGTVITGEDLPDESMLLLPDVGARIEVDNETIDVAPDSLVILPPGRSRVTAQGCGTVVRCCSHRAEALMAAAGNRADFDAPRPEVAPLEPWPVPVDGYRVRVYHLPSLTQPGAVMRVFRSTNLMVNVVAEAMAPREVTALSPHAHADFEQATVCVKGEYAHHLRTPWTRNLHHWRDDQHLMVGSPSVLVIPAGIVHTSRNTNADGARLIDVFAPPRADFALQPAWSCNGADYPLPPGLLPQARPV